MSTTNAALDPGTFRERGWWRDETFLDDLLRQVGERPHRLAIAARRLTGSRTDTLDFAELARLSERFAGGLAELGVRRGDFVAVQLPNVWEMVPLMFACLRLGAVICPVSPICPPEDLRHRLELTGARVCVTVPQWAGQLRAAEIVALSAELEHLEHVVVLDGRSVAGALDLHEQLVDVAWEENGPDLTGQATRPDDPYVVLFTSGTTGESKGVLHSPNTLHAAARGYVDTFAADEGLVAAVSTPLVHYSGFVQGVLAGVLVGGVTAFQDDRDNGALLDLVERYGATLLYGPPATLADVADSQRRRPRDVSTLQHAVVGSAPVMPHLVTQLRDTLGARTYSLWGMSEFGPVTVTRPDDHESRPGFSNGSPLPGAEVRVDPIDNASAVEKVGGLRVRGASQCLTYHRRDELFTAELDADGWFDTGDLAREDGIGGIRVLGRIRDTIVRDGTVAPAGEIEETISGRVDVSDTALVEVPAGAAGTALLAVVAFGQTGTGPSLPEVHATLHDAAVDRRFWPDRLVAVAALPKTLTGKVRKAELRQRYGD